MSAVASIRNETPVEIDIAADSALWTACPDADATVCRAIGAAAQAAGKAGTVAVMLTDDASIRVMNAQWRGIDKPTNVLSFPAAGAPGTPDSVHLGDIAIAYETVAAESASENKAFADHLAHLAIHGYLHLVGFDHETDAEATQMEHLETQILSGLGIADPYADTASAHR
jgi:probable rRNA maturation factor